MDEPGPPSLGWMLLTGPRSTLTHQTISRETPIAPISGDQSRLTRHMRLRSATALVIANMIGAPGQGFRIAMSVLDVFRSSVAAAALEMQLNGGTRALCTMCIGVGQGIAIALERV